MKVFASSFARASFALIVSVSLSAQSPELRQFIQSVDKIPSDQAIDRALKSSSLTTEDSPFHAVLQISQPGDAGSPYAGTIEVYWAGPSRYRVNVASKTFSQTQLKELEPLNSIDDGLFQVSNPTPITQQIQTVFVSMATNQSLFESVPTIEWPPVHEGKTEGNMIVHVITDRTGQVREAYKHNSDNAGTEAFSTQQALKYKFKPLLVNGVAVQMETLLVLHFSTKIGDPIPVLTGDDIKKYAPGCDYKPILPKGLLPSGTTFKIRVSVNERGEDTGEIFPQDIPWSVVQRRTSIRGPAILSRTSSTASHGITTLTLSSPLRSLLEHCGYFSQFLFPPLTNCVLI